MDKKTNMQIWSAVDTTMPGSTKQVSFGRKFTAIDAYSQIKKATEVFGPLGTGWGYNYTNEIIEVVSGEQIIFTKLKLWYKMDGKLCDEPVSVSAMTELVANGKQGLRLDTDAPKKSVTDALTKALSYLGFNADVFLGRFDDNKYVQKQAQAEREQQAAEAKQEQEAKPVPSKKQQFIEWFTAQAGKVGFVVKNTDIIVKTIKPADFAMPDNDPRWGEIARSLLKDGFDNRLQSALQPEAQPDPETKPQTDEEKADLFRQKCQDLLVAHFGDNASHHREFIYELTTYTTNSGKKMEGKTDLKDIKDSGMQVLYAKMKQKIDEINKGQK